MKLMCSFIEILVQVETKVSDRVGEGNGSLTDQKRFRWMLGFEQLNSIVSVVSAFSKETNDTGHDYSQL